MNGHHLAQWRGVKTFRQCVCTHFERQFVAPDDPDAGDAAVVVFAEQDDTGKGIFSELVQALEHAWNTMGSLGNNSHF